MRILIVCTIFALLLVPSGLAGRTAPTLTTSCDPCLADGSSVTFSGVGYRDNVQYAISVYNNDGSAIWGGPVGPSVGGVLVFTLGPLVQAGNYTARVFQNQGRGTFKLVIETGFLVT